MTPMAVPNYWPHDDHRQRAMPQQPYPQYPPPRNRQPQFVPRGPPSAGGYGAPPMTPASATSDILPPPFTSEYDAPPPSPRSHPRPPPVALHQQPLPRSSSRWDSLSNNTTPVIGNSPTSPRFGRGAPPPRSRPTTPAAYDVAPYADSHSEPPSRPLTAKSSFPDMRSSGMDGPPDMNFSRPRKQSIRQPVSDTPSRSRPPLLPTPSEDGTDMFHNPLPSPWRPRRPSVSSQVSSSTWAPGLSPTSGEFPDGRSRMRNAGPPPVSATRPHFSYSNRVDSSGSAPPTMGGAPWVNGDELRSSFRSQLTASSAPGTANTERSSILTKDSSATSFDANHDELDEEPSIDDVMGMYEQGFDDDDDHGYQDNGYQSDRYDSERDSRPPYADDLRSSGPPTIPESIPFPNTYPSLSPLIKPDQDYYREPSLPVQIEEEQEYREPSLPVQIEEEQEYREPLPIHIQKPDYHEPQLRKSEEQNYRGPWPVRIEEAKDYLEPLPVQIEEAEDYRAPLPVQIEEEDEHLPPPSRSRLDAEIRQSKMIFSSPAFMASVSHLAMEDEKEEKRDSGKSLESDPSETSHPTITRTNANGISNSSESSNVDTIRDSPSPILSSPAVAASTADSTYPEPRAPPPWPVETEEPGARDRYGFKKESQYISRKQYDKWNSGYSEYQARRKKKWQGFLKENSLMTDEPNRFPAPGPKTKKFVRKGIPPEWRGAAWFYYAGGPAILAKHSGLYAKMLHQKAKRIDVEAIERDLHRTFPDNVSYKPPGTNSVNEGIHRTIADDDTVQAKQDEPPIISSLRRVLFAFSIYNPNIGYCQSLNFIAGLLLLFVDTEEQCFWLLNVITHIYLPGTHEMSLEGSKVDLSVLMTEIRDTMPAVWDKIGGELEGQPNSRPSTSRSIRRPRLRRREQGSLPTERLPPITLCMTAWFMSCFIGTLPIETTLRVWDVFFYEGSKTLFRIALAVFKTGESEILDVSDPMEIFGVVQTLPRRMLDPNALLDACFKRRNGFGHLSQGAIDERRQERRDKSRSGDGRVKSGTMTGEDGVRRKNTLFGRKKRDLSRPRGPKA